MFSKAKNRKIFKSNQCSIIRHNEQDATSADFTTSVFVEILQREVIKESLITLIYYSILIY